MSSIVPTNREVRSFRFGSFFFQPILTTSQKIRWGQVKYHIKAFLVVIRISERTFEKVFSNSRKIGLNTFGFQTELDKFWAKLLIQFNSANISSLVQLFFWTFFLELSWSKFFAQQPAILVSAFPQSSPTNKNMFFRTCFEDVLGNS